MKMTGKLARREKMYKKGTWEPGTFQRDPDALQLVGEAEATRLFKLHHLLNLIFITLFILTNKKSGPLILRL